MSDDDVPAIQGCWNARIAQAPTRAEQERLYRLCPESLKPGAGSHMRTVNAVKERAKRRKVRKEIEGASAGMGPAQANH